MRRLIVFLFVIASATSFAQNEDAWRDTLLMARKSYEKKEYNKALKYYESAQKHAPEDIDLSDEMAQSAYHSRDFERAEKIYRQGSSTKMSKSARGDAMHNLGNAQMKQENYEGAIESYKEALRNNPNDQETRYNLSKAIRKMKEQRTPPPPKPNDPNNQDQNNGNQGDQGPQGQQGDQQNGQNQNNQSNSSQGNKSNGQNNPKNSSGQDGGGSEGSSEGKLSNQMVERMLDELSKKEGETKRKMMGAGSGGSSSKSGKDW